MNKLWLFLIMILTTCSLSYAKPIRIILMDDGTVSTVLLGSQHDNLTYENNADEIKALLDEGQNNPVNIPSLVGLPYEDIDTEDVPIKQYRRAWKWDKAKKKVIIEEELKRSKLENKVINGTR